MPITGYSNTISVTTLGLLDAYPNAAAAYSVRQLRNAYSGSAIRVRRSSDNAEQDIGFVSGNLDTSSLTSFCGAGNGFVTTWYDQSGNGRNATQTTAANQPQIVSGGSVINQNSKPCLQLDNSNDGMTTNVTLVKPFAMFIGFSQNSLVDTRMINSNSQNSLISARRNSYTVYTLGTVRASEYGYNNIMLLGALINNNTENKYYYNNNDITTDVNNNNWGNVAIGSSSMYPEPANGKLSELIIYSTDQSSNRTGINTNINTYYGIY